MRITSGEASHDTPIGPRLSRSSVDRGGTFGNGWLAVDIRCAFKQGARVFVLLAGAINRDLDGDLTTLNLFAVHLGARLLLQLFTREGAEAAATTLARLIASLELANHEFGDRAKSDFGSGRRVIGEDLEELEQGQLPIATNNHDVSSLTFSSRRS